MEAEQLKAVFRACDTKGTGFIGREDLRDICSKFGIQEQESDGIFEDLDHDQDGQICFKDFARGFRDFLSCPVTPTLKSAAVATADDDSAYLKSASSDIGGPVDREAAKKEIHNMLQIYKDELGEKGNLSEEKLLELYQELHASEKPQLVNHLESVLEDMMKSMKRLQTENQRLEQSWRREREDHEKYLMRIEEEMDNQVQKVEASVKEKAREEVEAERKALKTQMDAEMDELQTHLKLFQKVDTWLKTNQDPEMDSKVKNIRNKLEDAVQDNRQLRMNLMDTQTNIALMRSELSQLKTNYEEKCRELHEEKEKVMEYMHEQDYLSRQLHLLHDANRRLQDTNDGLRNAMENTPTARPLRNKRGSIVGAYLSDEGELILNETPRSRKSRSKKSDGDSLYGSEGWEKRSRASNNSRGSTMGKEDVNYGLKRLMDDLDSGTSTYRDTTLSDHYDDIEDDDMARNELDADLDCEKDGKEVGNLMKKRLISKLNIQPQTIQHNEIVIPLDDYTSCDYDMEPKDKNAAEVDQVSDNEDCKSTESSIDGSLKSDPPLPKKRTRLTKSIEGIGFVKSIPEVDENAPENIEPVNSSFNVVSYEPTGPPDATYKVVFVGDAAVGKSSFIIRLSKGLFVANLSSTLGVDFQMKTLNVDNRNVAVQLWDTAGQERFKSITQSYFRRSDGIMLLYDCTSERSFLNVREWAESIKDAADRNIPVMLCGNKVDLRESAIDEGKSVVRVEDGERLAKENGYTFVEVSAKSGSNVLESVAKLTRLMAANENMELQATGLKIKNELKPKKTTCCKS